MKLQNSQATQEQTESSPGKKEKSASAYFQRNGLPIVAVATAVGGPVAVVRLSGRDLEKFSSLLGGPLPDAGRFAYRALQTGSSVLIDRALVLRFKAPHSFTGEDVLEFQLHGVASLIEELLMACRKLGAYPALPGEFSFRAVLNSKMTLEEAEGLQTALSTESVPFQTATQLLGIQPQAQNAVQKSLGRMLKTLSVARGRVEAAIDFPEAEVEQASDLSSADELIFSALQSARDLLNSYEIFSSASSLPKVAIVGEPNVGKSTLFNILMGGPRVLVSAHPGTTRDVVEGQIQSRGGTRVKILDTAGLREFSSPGTLSGTVDGLEQEGIDLGIEMARNAQLVIWVQKAKDSINSRFAEKIRESFPSKKIISLYSHADRDEKEKSSFNFISDELAVRAFVHDAIERSLSLGADSLSEAVPSKRQFLLLQSSVAKIEEALASVRGSRPLELAASDLLEAEECLQKSLGQNVSDQYLTEIFQQFCLGK